MGAMNKELESLERLKRAKRVRERNEREAKKAEDNHWNFLAGKVIAQYLKDDLGIPVYKGEGATAKNREAFQPLENIARYLAAHKDFTARIMGGSAGEPPSDSSF